MPKPTEQFDVKKIMEEFDRSEKKIPARKGNFKINADFEQAMKKILKAKPEAKKLKRRKADERHKPPSDRRDK